eukprot:TRINITY_DN17650_c0_g1_i5.p1 TRINITY_DN17650_c0_g1~~TRINITY_DN17650_c0_g1_i5.p1  ORF type:complete len:505 (+),score=165.69 TRINITY_DN17650_c0_g1_i5:95-1609(+)
MCIRDRLSLSLCLALSLPPLFIALRFRALTEINGEEGVQLPDASLDITGGKFKEVYNSPAADGRSKQSQYGLSDFFWYLLAPAHAIHQEHLESKDVRYQITAALTRKLVAVKEERLIAIAIKHAEALFSADKLGSGSFDASRHTGSWDSGFLLGRSRDLFFPLFERMIFELVFEEEAMDDDENRVCCDSAENVLNAIKGTARREMNKRRELCDLLKAKLGQENSLNSKLDERIGQEEWALFLQGVFFTTGVVQLAEGMAHLAVALAQHPQVTEKLRNQPAGDSKYMGHVLAEALRVWPLFGIAHRITSDEIQVDDSDTVLPAGSVLCFNYPKYHMEGYEQPERFWPERWNKIKERNSSYMPFGPTNNRPCPGKRLSQIWMKAVTQVMIERVDLFSSAEHTRSLPCGGPVLMLPRTLKSGTDKLKPSSKMVQSVVRMAAPGLMYAMRGYMSVENFFTTTQQAVNELIMLRESKKLQLAQNYFLKQYKDEDLTEANKPCLSNQLYR